MAQLLEQARLTVRFSLRRHVTSSVKRVSKHSIETLRFLQALRFSHIANVDWVGWDTFSFNRGCCDHTYVMGWQPQVSLVWLDQIEVLPDRNSALICKVGWLSLLYTYCFIKFSRKTCMYKSPYCYTKKSTLIPPV